MEEGQERILQDWGSYEPEVQKALRFVAMTGGTGTAKQMASAIDREYAKRKQEKPTRPVRQKRSAVARHTDLTESDFEVIVDDWIAAHPQRRIDEKQRQVMIRVHLMLQKHTPGWIL